MSEERASYGDLLREAQAAPGRADSELSEKDAQIGVLEMVLRLWERWVNEEPQTSNDPSLRYAILATRQALEGETGATLIVSPAVIMTLESLAKSESEHGRDGELSQLRARIFKLGATNGELGLALVEEMGKRHGAELEAATLRNALRTVMECPECGGRDSNYVDDGEGDVISDPCDCRTRAYALLEGESYAARIDAVVQAAKRWVDAKAKMEAENHVRYEDRAAIERAHAADAAESALWQAVEGLGEV